MIKLRNFLCNKKFFIWSTLFILFLLILRSIFANLETHLNADSYSYQYFLDTDSIYSISFYQRPILYPLLLFVVNKLSISLGLLQFLIATIALSLLTLICYRFTHNYVICLLVALIGLFNFELLSFIKVVAPETLLFLIMVVHLFIIIGTKQFKNKIVALMISSLALTLTKPIFIYWPFFLIILIFFKHRKNVMVKKVTPIASLIYILPIVIFSLLNFFQTERFYFSQIADANLVGKVMQYQLLPKKIPIDLEDTSDVFLYEQNRADWNPWRLIGEQKCDFNQCYKIYDYARLAVMSNLPQFLINASETFLETVFLLSYYYLRPSFGNSPEFMVASWYQQIYRFVSRYGLRYYSLFFIPPFLILIELLLMLFKVRDNKLEASDWNYICLLSFVAYYLLITAFGAYGSYARLLAPITPFSWLLFLWTIQRVLKRTIHYLKRKL